MTYSQNRAFAESGTGFLTWKQYGAVGDGTTDDTAAINACHAAAHDAGLNVEIGIPSVSYRITGPIKIYDKFTLRGSGPDQSKIFADRTNGFVMENSLPTVDGSTGDFNLGNFLLTGNDDTATDGNDYIGIPLVRATRYSLTRINVRGFTQCVTIDGTKNNSGTVYGNAQGLIQNCELTTDNTAQQQNPTNNYPGKLVEVIAEADGTGGADGVLFLSNRIYAEILAATGFDTGNGSTTTFAPFTALPASKYVTADNHVLVQYVSSAGGSLQSLTAGVDYTIDRTTNPNNPSFDFSAGTSPLGAPVSVSLLSDTGDASTKSFRLSARPTFASVDGGRAVDVTVAGSPKVGGTDYAVVDSNNRAFTFLPAAVTTATDKVALVAGDISSLNYATDISSQGTGRLCRLSTTGTLPAGLAAATDYYMVVDATNNTVQFASSYSNATAGTPVVINITDQGTGTHTLAVQDAVEFLSAPAAAAAIVILNTNLRFRWIDPNAESCVTLCPGAQRVSFISNLIGGGIYGIDFNQARRCVGVDNYFQIGEYAVRFGPDAEENTLLGFSSRTDATFIYGFALDEAVTPTNAYDEFIAQASAVRDFMYLKESYTEADSDASRIRKNNGQLQLDALNASDSVRLGVGGVSRYLASGSADRHTFFNQSGSEIARFNATGSLMIGATALTASEKLHVNGDVDITGTLTAGTFVPVMGNITITGNTIASTNTNGDVIFDPDGTGEVQIDSNAVIEGTTNLKGHIDLGESGSAMQIEHAVNDQNVFISGGSNFNAGAAFWLYGGTSAQSSRMILAQDGTTRQRFDSDIMFYNASGSEIARFDESAAALLVGATSPIASEKLRVDGAVALGLGTQNLEILDAGTAGATHEGWIEVEIGGVVQYIQTYTSK